MPATFSLRLSSVGTSMLERRTSFFPQAFCNFAVLPYFSVSQFPHAFRVASLRS